MEIIVATSNIHKLHELRNLLPDSFKIKSLRDIGYDTEIIENGTTFSENALIKARQVANDTGINTLADDSGLEVEALNGAPGIFSARYAGANASDKDNVNKVLNAMQGKNNRKARFVAVIVLILNGIEHTFLGTVEGRLTLKPEGINGFGYDPIFIPSGYQKTFAELPAAVKAEISHRASAARELIKFIDSK
jgi:XTP/dITP diphosphohydrolase